MNWLVPKELYEELDKEFGFDFDPCPYPKESWDGLEVEWGSVNFVNPPFLKRDGGPLRLWISKAFEEHAKGKTIVMLLPATNENYELLWSKHPNVRYLGSIRYEDTETGKPSGRACHAFLYIMS